MTERRTTFSRTYYNADGTCTAEITARPMHYQASDKSFLPVDTSLTSCSRAGFAASNETNPLRTYLPETAGGWIRVESGETSVSFRPIRAASSSLQVSGRRAAYANVAESTSLAYTIEPGQLKETIILNAPRSHPFFAFSVLTEGLTPKVNADGSVSLTDLEGQAGIIFEAPWMRDARGNVSTNVDVSLVPAMEGYVYTLSPDPEWLNKAAYPVEIDPTVTLSLHGAIGYALYNAPTQYGVATPTYYVGVTGADQAGAIRSVMRIDTTGLPLDIDVNNAYLNISCTSVLNGNTQTIEATEYPFLANWPVDAKWSTDPNRTDLRVGREATPLVNGIAKTLTGTATGSVMLDVTDPLRNWTDRRVLETGTNTFTSLPFNVMLRDTTDYDGAVSVSGNMRGFTASTVSVSVNYTEGWYTFQGNRRRTGRTQYWFPEDWVRSWRTNLPTPSGDVYNRDYIADDESYARSLSPGVIAIPNPSDPTSSHPVLYAVVNDSNDARVYRIVDNGSSATYTSRTFTNFRVHSTPLTIGNRLIIAGNELDGNSVETTGKVYALDPANLSTTQWTRTMPGKVYSSPVFVPLTSSYTVMRADLTTYPWTCTNYILIGCNHTSDGEGYLDALSHANGKHVWGTVDETSGDYIEGLVPLVWPSTQSSPSMDQQRAYIEDYSCWINVRNILDGSLRWESVFLQDRIESSVSLFDERLFYGGTLNNAVSWRENTYPWGELFGEMIWAEYPGSSIYATLPFDTDRRTVFYGTVGGTARGVGIDEDIANPGSPKQRWVSPFDVPDYPNAIYASPIVAGAPGQSNTNVLVPSDSGYVYLLRSVDGNQAGTVTDNGGPLNGKIRASMAAFRGHVYILTEGGGDSQAPSLYCFED